MLSKHSYVFFYTFYLNFLTKKNFYLTINNEYRSLVFTILWVCLLYSNDWNIIECECTYATYGSYYGVAHEKRCPSFSLLQACHVYSFSIEIMTRSYRITSRNINHASMYTVFKFSFAIEYFWTTWTKYNCLFETNIGMDEIYIVYFVYNRTHPMLIQCILNLTLKARA